MKALERAAAFERLGRALFQAPKTVTDEEAEEGREESPKARTVRKGKA